MNVLLHTFGCKANQYDTEVVRQRLEAAGCVIVSRPEDADAAVVNSCAVTHVGEAKMRGYVRRIARRRPGLKTVVMGCAAALDDGRLASLPSVSAVVGGADAEPVAAALGVAGGPAGALRTFAGGSRAWLKIQDGCDEHCTFCATTLARGANASRRAPEVIAEARALAERHSEIVLTGVHIGTYGADLGGGVCLGSLVRALVESVPDVRFRLGSVEATEVDGTIARLFADAPERLAPHVHAPLQSGSDRLLRRMGRHWYTASTYRKRLETIAGALPVLGLGADVIVGFPGETDEDHRATVRLVEALPFTYLHVFPYSARSGTAALRLGTVPEPHVVRERGAELRTLSDRKAAAYRAGRSGGVADLVLEGRRGGQRDAVTEDYLAVQIPADAEWVTGRSRIRARLVETGGRLTGQAA